MIKTRKILLQVLTVLALLSVSLTQCSKDEDEHPSITISPETGPVGTAVTLTGKGFGATVGDNIVKFNDVSATVTTASTTQLMVEVPVGATTGAVTVQIGSNTMTGPVFTVTEPEVTKAYYIKFRANGVLKIFEDGNPGYQACGECSCSYMPVLNDVRNSGIDICNDSNDWVTAADIQAWNKKKILFNTNNVFPVTRFGYTENSISYHTDYVASQSGSEVNITNVVSDGSFGGHPAYKVSGTFLCKVAKSDGSSATTITEGEFVVRYTEDF